MNSQLLIRRLAGTLVLTSLALGYFLSPYWFIITGFVGLNLFQSSFTNFCPVQNLMEKKRLSRKELYEVHKNSEK